MILKDKKIILGLTGSIAAYKAAYLLRYLVKEGADVQVIMTPAAREFITPVTMSALSGKPVLGAFFENKDGTWHSHVDLGLWADLFLIAPASANTMGKMANGICDNLLLTTYLSAKCPVMIAPAMDLDMFQHPANLKNIDTLIEYGAHIIEPGVGALASGLHGKGRMEEPEQIVEKVKAYFANELKVGKGELVGKKILVNAGPTYERIDPVRFIGNFSSGKMGYAIAEELSARGAEVTLVSGPVNIETEQPRINIINVTTAEEMYEACIKAYSSCDGAILSAAVADYTPVNYTDKKMKSDGGELNVTLSPTRDIAKELGNIKEEKQFLVGFALETDNALEHANKKLVKKNLDFIVLNSLENEGAGFGVDTNKITIVTKDNKIEDYPLKSKREVASDIVDRVKHL
ncbi:bifunctional phosphopantothenoylcysteine decarboxylase/phosphopantothenate--cysteine ligase CoaBC [Saccharicrinis aurantiacus]|uniref:bifunctional phosphopantothenoylcysteine decarboxylase/phosphopantothenate--cysteine ligase CoaBC n=1 Tax=Saccharicrinis aurantiacus TaxID=1849719 RepID=UPI0024909461|nr:bifunctional phosphopantothenoylcysteine decarboxylase/phosphopantothenate--cysteine ligase CoaBC [Saccharicrinis aurantiacus]